LCQQRIALVSPSLSAACEEICQQRAVGSARTVHSRFFRDAAERTYDRSVAEASRLVRGVLFDWGGVITSPIVDTVAAWLESDGIDRDSYAAAMRPWVHQAYGSGTAESPIHALERGEVSDEEFEATLAALLLGVDGAPVAADGLLKRMFAASVLQEEMLALVGELRRRGIRTGLLSNSWGARDGYPRRLFDDLFDVVVISGEVGMRKPEERIFQLAATRLGLMPAECAFVDDVEGNVVAARALGFHAVHHSEPALTRSELFALLARPGAAAP
jgi:epoxide hydrolase-like predicted phosphatase